MKPTWRKPIGILGMLAALAVYAVVAVTLLEPAARWPLPLQVLAYLLAGTVWILPLGPFLKWMETGRFR
jgi:hypothetical protein